METPEKNELDFVEFIKLPTDENNEDEVLLINFEEKKPSLANLLYECFLNNNFDAKIIHKQNKDFILYFKRDQVYVKNLKDDSETDLSLTEIQCVWLTLNIVDQVNYFDLKTIGYEII